MSQKQDKKPLPVWLVYFPYVAMALLLFWVFIFFKGILSIESGMREASAVNTAENYIRSIESFRTLYTTKVVEPLRRQGLNVTHDYHNKDMTIALPATLSMELGNEIAESTSQQLIFRLYSQYPFPWRKQGGVNDDFEQQALLSFNSNKQKPYYRFEEHEGKKVLRYARADVMRASCVSCHNSHPQTPKSDWHVGDVRGALSVTVNMTRQNTKELNALHETRFGLIMFAFILLGILIVAGQVIKKHILNDD